MSVVWGFFCFVAHNFLPLFIFSHYFFVMSDIVVVEEGTPEWEAAVDAAMAHDNALEDTKEVVTFEVFDATDKLCCVCHEEFTNGDILMHLGCGNHHVLCEGCHEGWTNMNDSDVTFPKCPICREFSDVTSVYDAQVFAPGSGKVDDPIVVE